MSNFDFVPSPVVVTDTTGHILEVNAEFVALVGGVAQDWLGEVLDVFLPPASRIFLQTHVWPILLNAGQVKELHLHIVDAEGRRLPVFLNCTRSQSVERVTYIWLWYVARERAEFESQLLSARNLTQEYAEAVAKSEAFVKTIANNVPGLVAYWDKALRCKFANEAHYEWFGKSAREVIGLSMSELLGERVFDLEAPYIAGVLSGKAQQFERTLVKADGSIGYTIANYFPDVDKAGSVVGFYVLGFDVTRIKKTEIELRLAASVFDCADEGIMVTDHNGTILTVNRAFSQITGFSEEDAIGKTPRIMKCDRTSPEYYRELWCGLTAVGKWEGETWNCRKGGEEYVEHHSITTIRDQYGAVVRFVSIFSDVTERWRKEVEMEQRAFHDALTGLPNRYLLSERLGQMLMLVQRERRSVAVMFLDLDGFKQINDAHGHEVGDAVLATTAHRLLGLVRQSDVVARLGGDEFVVVLHNPANHQEVVHVAERIISCLGESLILNGITVKTGVSVGISMYPSNGDTPAALLKSADSAMYLAKDAGKNNFQFASAGATGNASVRG